MEGKKNHPVLYIAVFILIVVSRLPFIGAGYGAEEDAWGLRLTAENIARSGNYEVSRLPGHPFQEIIYSFIWQQGFLMMNLLTVLISSAGIIFFMLIVKKFSAGCETPAAIALAFTPVVYINSCNAMDYNWALAFILASFYFVASGRMILAGVLLGIAAGCRITSAAMLLPFLLYIYYFSENPVKKSIMLSLALAVAGLICFLPVINTYGFSFFTYYKHFPLPSLAKNIYKGSIAVWGLPGVLFTAALLMIAVYRMLIQKQPFSPYAAVLVTAIVLFLAAFIKLPLKAAFMIPVVPFILLLIIRIFGKKVTTYMAGVMILSSFTFGINLADVNRGNRSSQLSWQKEVASQMVSFDVLKGPIQADYEKQKNIIYFSGKVIEASRRLKGSKVIIAGWYLNFINVLNETNDPLTKFVYYIDEGGLQNYVQRHVPVYYLPEQDKFNDMRFGFSSTGQMAQALKVNGNAGG